MINSHFFHHLIHLFQYIFVQFKHYAMVVFFAVVFLPLLFSNGAVYGEQVIGSIKTPVELTVNNEHKSFISYQGTIEGALLSEGIVLQKNDITEPAMDTKLVGEKMEVKLIPAVPVLVSDNNQEFMVQSAYTEPEAILKQAEIKVYPEDRISADLITDPADERAVGQKVTIERAPVYTVNVDDGVQTIRSWGETVEEVLKNRVTLGLRDIIDPPLTTQAQGGEITITRVNVVETEEDITIPYETITKKDYSMYEGESTTKVAGSNGLKKQQVKYTYHNGIVISRVVLSSIVVTEPVTEMVVKGVKPYNAGVWWNTLVAAGTKWGVDPRDMYNVMNCESHGNPYAGSTYKGLFQYSAETWAGASAAYPGGEYKGAAITNGTAQIYVTAWKVSQSGWSAWGCKP
jgi:uncharacterized protein YabE (DUF348 family)